MALKGNLRDFSVTQLLNLVNVAHKTGTLVVERSQEQIFVSFKEGKLAFARNGSDPGGLTMVLYQARKLNAAQVRAINERSGGMSDKELGLVLINANYITQQEIISSLQSYYLSMVNRLFTWSEGLFRFESELMPPNDKITVRINLENLIIDGSRKMREWEQLQGEIPSLDMALKFSDRPGINIRNLNLSADEWKVISFINPKNTIRQIARAANKNDLEIRRIVYSFIQAGLVEMVRPEGKPVQPPPADHGFPQRITSTLPAGQVSVSPPIQPVSKPVSQPVSQPVGPPARQPIGQPSSPATTQPASPVPDQYSGEPVNEVPAVQPIVTLPQVTTNKPEFKSLINRIIERIRSI